MKAKKLVSILMASAMVLSLAACGSKKDSSDGGDSKVYNIGICQLIEHEALDAATKGFQDACEEKFGKDNVKFDLQNAQGEQSMCSTIINNFVSADVDLILANATLPLQTAVQATPDIPILGTSITDYPTALGVEDWTGATGINVSGTSDLAPLDKQEEMLKELFPDAKQVGILYCSAEANSKYQAEAFEEALKKDGIGFKEYTIADSNELQAVVTTAAEECDVIYIPTDNTLADGMTTVSAAANECGIPTIVGESGMVGNGALATYGINYYELGKATAAMAVKILKGEAEPASMPVEYQTDENVLEVAINTETAEKLGITIPDDLAKTATLLPAAE